MALLKLKLGADCWLDNKYSFEDPQGELLTLYSITACDSYSANDNCKLGTAVLFQSRTFWVISEVQFTHRWHCGIFYNSAEKKKDEAKYKV